MKALLSLVLVAALLASPNEVREYRIDAGHTDVAFSIGFLGHPVRGRFDDVRGTISYAPGNPAASGISVVIATKSISTGSAHRDEHLRSPDFLRAQWGCEERKGPGDACAGDRFARHSRAGTTAPPVILSEAKDPFAAEEKRNSSSAHRGPSSLRSSG